MYCNLLYITRWVELQKQNYKTSHLQFETFFFFAWQEMLIFLNISQALLAGYQFAVACYNFPPQKIYLKI